MRNDTIIEQVIKRCDSLRKSGLWPNEQKLNPRRWLNNFEAEDRHIAALLLEHFEYFNATHSIRLLKAGFHELVNRHAISLKESPSCAREKLLRNAIYTPVQGERANISDSGNYLCRLIRQTLGIQESQILPLADAIHAAFNGTPVILVDDFVGSGDQFIATIRNNARRTFPYTLHDCLNNSDCSFSYLGMIATSMGAARIRNDVPSVTLGFAHVLQRDQSIFQLSAPDVYGIQNPSDRISRFLDKYHPKLRPRETYILNTPAYLKYGYKEAGLLLGFEHSIPDATLPIFWSVGDSADWHPLVARS